LTGLTGFIGFFLCQLPDEADRMQFAYAEGKLNTLVEGCFFLPFFPAFFGAGWKGKIILMILLILSKN